MIAFLNGTLVEKTPVGILLDVNGTGYELAIPLSTYDALPATGGTLRILTHLHVREDLWQLFGFATSAEKSAFKLLLEVNGVGPKVALNALSGITIPELHKAIVDGNVKRLGSISGIGKKTAERIVIELKDKIHPLMAFAPPSGTTGGTAPKTAPAIGDTLLALASLGYPQDAARKMVQAALDAGADAANTETLLKAALGTAR
ncbi:MAG: Holliday junction branch migration protein RuvA [Kiritimatiellaeota bacterium]|nr:Holliday junction branch migration protein RuvA [Kiritimatiellota bacterium]